MIKGIGVDVVEISRIRDAVSRLGDRFLNRIYTPHELAYCTRRRQSRYPELAARFAAKEAFAKAQGTGMIGIHWKDIEVRNDPKGKPYLHVRGVERPDVHLSLTHSKEFAVAMVVMEHETI